MAAFSKNMFNTLTLNGININKINYIYLFLSVKKCVLDVKKRVFCRKEMRYRRKKVCYWRKKMRLSP